MDPELQAIREARLAELKKQTGRSSGDGNQQSSRPAGDSIAQFLEPQALERLSRVSLVRPDRAQAVEGYLKQLISRGQVSRKISEQEIVDILNGIARDQNRKNDTKIIFDRRETVENSVSVDEESEDDFFD